MGDLSKSLQFFAILQHFRFHCQSGDIRNQGQKGFLLHQKQKAIF
jgi:hypothetical protein